MGEKIAVIGFGPAGIAVTHALLKAGRQPVVLEGSSGLGGLWNPANHRTWASVHTNLTKFTCAFAGFPWSSEAPLFPTVREVCEYLQAYVDQFIPLTCVKFNSRVLKVARVPDSSRFVVTWQDTVANRQFSDEFDEVVVASGFFAQKKVDVTLQSLLSEPTKFGGKVIHSSDYDTPTSFAGQTVAVVGGVFSGSEIATEIAQVARQVHHITPQEVFIVPRFLPENPNDPKTAFLPLEMIYYQLEWAKLQEQLDDPQQPPLERVFKSKQEIINTYQYFQSLTKQHLASMRPEMGCQARVAIADHYFTQYNCAGIRQVKGYVTGAPAPNTIMVSPQREGLRGEGESAVTCSSPQTLENIDALVLCTGYKPDLSFLHSSILEKLDYDDKDDYLPCNLVSDIFSPHVPGLFFVGFYRGPYFAGIQAQAEVAAHLLTNPKPIFTTKDYTRHDLLYTSLRHSPAPQRSQFPHPDSVGQVLDLWRRLDPLVLQEMVTAHSQAKSVERSSVFIPAVLVNDHVTIEQMKLYQASMRMGKHLATNLFQALAYTQLWTMHREILDHSTSGMTIVNGQVTMRSIGRSPRRLLYQETGRIEIQQKSFEVSQSYIYEDNASKDCIDIFFSQLADKEVIDRPFLTLQFYPQPTVTDRSGGDSSVHPALASVSHICSTTSACSSPYNPALLEQRREEMTNSVALPDLPQNSWSCVADHLCGEDYYRAAYAFQLSGLIVERIHIVFDVLGPRKNYRSQTVLSVPTP